MKCVTEIPTAPSGWLFFRKAIFAGAHPDFGGNRGWGGANSGQRTCLHIGPFSDLIAAKCPGVIGKITRLLRV